MKISLLKTRFNENTFINSIFHGPYLPGSLSILIWCMQFKFFFIIIHWEGLSLDLAGPITFRFIVPLRAPLQWACLFSTNCRQLAGNASSFSPAKNNKSTIQIQNIATGEPSQAITPFHFFDFFDYFDYHVSSSLCSSVSKVTSLLDCFFIWHCKK